MNEKEALKSTLTSRFAFYCSTSGRLSREEQKTLAEKLAEDLITNEWETLKAHLTYWEAQGFYGSKEMWDMVQRASERLKPQDTMQVYPIPDAIVHALLDAESRLKRLAV